jgi:geranylgeranyl diphosphate/geranylgeranyl-bacteriochlorophyllide a reductase
MRDRAKIGIIGAGPAGARAAELLARQGVDVVMLDPKAPWEKPCAGGLTPPAFDEIPELEGLKELARPISDVRIETSPEDGFSVTLERPMWIISRKTLATWQLDRAIGAGAEHLRVKVRSVRRVSGAWLLETDEGPLRVGFLIGADGGASLVRRVAAPKLEIELAPTRVAYPREAGPTSNSVVLQFHSSLAGYLWDFPRPDHRSVGIGVPNGTWRRRKLDDEIDKYRESSEPCDCPGLERAGAVIGTAQLGHGDFSKIAGEDFALLGDAAGLADPLTGEGIQNALVSAGLFAQAWAEGTPKSYPGRVRRTFDREFDVARVIRRFVFESDLGIRLIHRALVSDFWHGAVAAVVNGFNEHDTRIWSTFRRWSRSARRVHAEPGQARRISREPVPCACSGDKAHDVGAPCHEESVAA